VNTHMREHTHTHCTQANSRQALGVHTHCTHTHTVHTGKPKAGPWCTHTLHTHCTHAHTLHTGKLKAGVIRPPATKKRPVPSDQKGPASPAAQTQPKDKKKKRGALPKQDLDSDNLVRVGCS